MKINLIPPASDKPSNNYYCTWNTQNFGRYDAVNEADASVFIGQSGAKKARAFLNEEHLTDPQGFLNQYAAVRKELWFLVDDGWDVPYDIHPDKNIRSFGSLEVSTERFPSCTGTPAERLHKLNKIVKNAGWRGLGIWVASQAVGEEYGEFLSYSESLEYWTERLKWSHYAGIGYWKIDWGCHQFDPEWRLLIDSLRDKYASELVIEHCHPAAAPLNNVDIRNGQQVSDGRFASWEPWPERWTEIARNSQIFRTYDVLSQLSQPTTVDRIAVLLEKLYGSDCVLNCEDEVYIAAALGLNMGVMRSGMNHDIPVFCFDPQRLSHRLKEVERAVRWQRIAPAFPVGTNSLYVSDETVCGRYSFKQGETWMEDYIGKTVLQACPAYVSRGIKPDEIRCETEDKPIFVASRFQNGAVAMATLARTFRNGVCKTPLCTPVFSGLTPDTLFGIFGVYKSIVLKFTQKLDGIRVYMQDAASETAYDVTDKVKISQNSLEIPGQIINEISECTDESEPGVVLKVQIVG